LYPQIFYTRFSSKTTIGFTVRNEIKGHPQAKTVSIRYKNGGVKVNELLVEVLDQMVTMGDTARQLKEALSGDGHRSGELLQKVMTTDKQTTRQGRIK
jgi:hypothetical protein